VTDAHRDGIDGWAGDAWRREAIAWIDRQLDEAGLKRTGDVEQPRIRPWGTLLTVPTSRGRYWLKATAPETAFEVAISPLLHRAAPESVLEPLATDAERGWILLPDGGRHLTDVVTGSALVPAMATAMARYGELQRRLAPEADVLITLGVADMRPAGMRHRFEEALALAREHVDRHGTDDDRRTLARIEAAREAFAATCDRLAASPVPPSLDHNDLHPRNVLVRDAGGIDGARFFDWGDSVVAHPFASMLVPLRSMQVELGVRPDDPALLTIRDAYLEVFGDLGSRETLVEELELACHVGKVARSLVWHRALALLGDEGHDFASAPFEWLSEVLAESYLGSLD